MAKETEFPMYWVKDMRGYFAAGHANLPGALSYLRFLTDRALGVHQYHIYPASGGLGEDGLFCEWSADISSIFQKNEQPN